MVIFLDIYIGLIHLNIKNFIILYLKKLYFLIRYIYEGLKISVGYFIENLCNYFIILHYYNY